MVSPSRCPPWQPERPGPTRREPRRAQRSYTTRRDTIRIRKRADRFQMLSTRRNRRSDRCRRTVRFRGRRGLVYLPATKRYLQRPPHTCAHRRRKISKRQAAYPQLTEALTTPTPRPGTRPGFGADRIAQRHRHPLAQPNVESRWLSILPSRILLRKSFRGVFCIQSFFHNNKKILKCPSGDFMSRMNRLSGAPS